MKKQWTFPLALAALMLAAGALRFWQRRTAFEWDTGLLIPGMPATGCLTALAVLAAAVLGLLAWKTAKDREFRSYLDAFACPAKVAWPVYILAGAMLVAAGAMGLHERAIGLSGQVSQLILSVGLLPAGAGVGLVGWLNSQTEEGKGRFAWPLLLPGYCGCLWLICAYQTHTGNPNEMEYLFYFLGMVCAVVCCYLMAAFSFEKPMARACLWTGGMALVLLATAMVDQLFLQGDETGSRMTQYVILGYMLYVAAQLTCLLRRTDHPAQLEPWVAPEETENEENEVTEHE